MRKEDVSEVRDWRWELRLELDVRGDKKLVGKDK